MGLKSKLAGGFLLPLAVTIVTVGVLQAGYTADFMIGDLASTGDLLVRELFEQMRMAHPLTLDDLARVPQFRTFLNSTLAFGEAVISVRIENPYGITVVAAPTYLERQRIPAAPSLAELQGSGRWFASLRLLVALWHEPVFEVRRPVEINAHTAGTIKIDLSARLISVRIRHALATILYMTAIALGVGAATGLLMVGAVSRSLTAIAAGVEQLAEARSGVRLAVGSRDEVGVLADRFNQLSNRIAADRQEWSRERERLVGVLRSINDAVLLLDPHAVVLFANPEALGSLGLPAGATEGRSMEDLLDGSHPLRRLIGPALAAGSELTDAALELKTGFGARYFTVSLLPLASKAAGMLLIMRDVTPISELEQVLEQVGSGDEGRMVAALSHQMRNPLNAMSLQLEMVREDAAKGEQIEARVKSLQSEIVRINQAITSLLRFLRLERLNLTHFEIGPLLRQLAKRCEKRSIHVRCELDDTIGAIEADRALLEQALENLAVNGIQAMPQGGLLEFIMHKAQDGKIEIVIRDDGCGMSAEVVQQVFDFYFSTKEGGTGVGMPMARRIIEMHRGIVEVSSQPGAGTVVRIELPVVQSGCPGLSLGYREA